jgi:glyoxylase I family protein
MTTHLLLIALISYAFAFNVNTHQYHYYRVGRLQSQTNDISTSSPPPFTIQHIDHIVLRCRNFAAMFDFYHRILGCTVDEPIYEHLNRFDGALTHLRAGSCYIDLISYDINSLSKEGREAVTRMHGGGAGLDSNKRLQDVNISSDDSTMDHLCLRIEPFDKDLMMKYLKDENVHIIGDGDRRLGADGIGPSIYAADPEGNVIELKGNPYERNSQSDIKSSQQKQNDMQQIDTNSMKIDETRSKDDTNAKYSQKTDETRKDDDTIHNLKDMSSDNENIPATPCNRICRYNSNFFDGQVCIGCYREAFEVECWQSQTPLQKAMTLLDCIDRCNDSSRDDKKFDGSISVEELNRQYDHWSSLAKK